MSLDSAAQGTKTWLENRHPSYKKHYGYWDFYRRAYLGGADFDEGKYLFPHSKEEQKDYDARLRRAVRCNHTQQVLDTVLEYLFKTAPSRDNTNPLFETFWNNVDREQTKIDDFMKQVGCWLEDYGITYVVVDKPKDLAVNALEEQQRGLLPYVYQVSPLDMLDIRYDDAGNVVECLVRETYRPIKSIMDERKQDETIAERFRLWGQFTWSLWQLDANKREPVLIEEGVNPLGFVPIVPVRRAGGADRYSAPSFVQDIAKLDCQIYNYDSLLSQILYDQTFSTLAMPVEGTIDNKGSFKKLQVWLGTKAILPYKAIMGATNAKPEYISPDASQGTLLKDTIKEKIEQIYRLKNLANEIPDSGSSQQPQSGVSQAYDFEKLNSKLATEADILEKAEKDICKIVSAWMDKPLEVVDDNIVDYPDNFDVKSLMDDLEELMLEESAKLPDTFLKEKRKQIVRKAMPKLDDALMQKIDAEIESYDPEAAAIEAAKLNKGVFDGGDGGGDGDK